MGSLRFPSLTSVSLQQALSDIQAPTKAHLRQGFGIIADLDVARIDTLARAVIDHIDSLAEVDTEQLAIELRMQEDSVTPAISAASMTVAFLSSWKESAEEVVDGLVKASLVQESDRGAVNHFVGIISSRRSEIKKVLNLRSLAEETFPAFRDFDTSIDMRLDFKKDQVETAVPVLLVHLRTDVDQARLFFQMTKSDVQQLSEQLKRSLLQLESAEKWASDRAPKGN